MMKMTQYDETQHTNIANSLKQAIQLFSHSMKHPKVRIVIANGLSLYLLTYILTLMINIYL